jgi:hypothetical protein
MSEEACQARRAAGFVIQGRGRDAKYLPGGIAAMSSIAATPNALMAGAEKRLAVIASEAKQSRRAAQFWIASSLRSSQRRGRR